MKCKCKYYLIKDGKLYCSQCGEPAQEKDQKQVNRIEDKMGKRAKVK